MIQMGERGEAGSPNTAGTIWATPFPPTHPLCPLPGPNNSCFLSYRGVWGLNVPPGVPMIQLGERGEAGGPNTAGTVWATPFPSHLLLPLPGPNNSCFLFYRGVWGLNVPPGVPMSRLGERGEAGVQAQQAPFGPPPSPPPHPLSPLPGPNNSRFLSYRGVWGLSIPPGVPMIQMGERGEAGGPNTAGTIWATSFPPHPPFAPFQDPTIHASYLIKGFGVSVPPLGSL